jgi:hypothetical protein
MGATSPGLNSKRKLVMIDTGYRTGRLRWNIVEEGLAQERTVFGLPLGETSLYPGLESRRVDEIRSILVKKATKSLSHVLAHGRGVI